MKSLQILFTLATICFCPQVSSEKRGILVGGLFHGDDKLSQIAFKYGIMRINQDSSTYYLNSTMDFLSRTDSFAAQQIVCKLASEGVDVIFGPGSLETSGAVSSIAEKFEIPHIIYHWQTKALYWEKTEEHSMTLNLYPDSDFLAEAYASVLDDYSWKSYTIIFESQENLVKLKDILQIHDPQSSPVTLRQLDDNYGSLLKEVHARGGVNIVLDISTEKIVPFLREAATVNMLGDYNNYFITNLDAHTLDLGEITELTSNITCLRLVEEKSEPLKAALRDWNQQEIDLDLDTRQVPHEAALIHDALKIYHNSLEILVPGKRNSRPRHDCNKPDVKTKTNGFAMAKFLKTQVYDGITGKVEFNTIEPYKGSRTQFKIEILEYSKKNFSKIGYWETTDKVKYDREIGDPEQQMIEAIQNKKFNIVVKFGEPFLREKKAEEGVMLEGNARYEGYVVDLINRIQQNLRFKYELEVVPDGQYGSLNPQTKKWNGLVKHLLERKADLAVADLTITYERKTAVDFTMPFMSLGVGILYVTPPKKEANLFSFLDPFTVEVWLYTGLAYVTVSVLVFVLSRINNDDWESAHPCNQEPEEVESIWNILNCVWLAMGSIMGQGCDILPKGSSTRIVTGMWWFFALIMLASYTANLAAFLTADRLTSSIDSAEDLAKQVKIKYGAVLGGSTIRFFQESNFSTYQRMWAAMESNGDIVHTKSNIEGVARVKKENGNYAFMMESVPMEYVTNQECTLQQVGELLDSKGYGIALPINSPYRKAFSEQILKLSESGVLNELKTKWWKSNIVCPDDKPHDDLGIGNVGGVFLVVAGGCFVALIIALMEFLWNIEKIAIEEKISPWDAFKSEISFAFNIWIIMKPVRSKSSELVSRKSTPPRSLKSRYGSETRSFKNKSTRSLNYDDVANDGNSRSLLNLH